MIVHLVEIVLLGNLKMYLDDTIVEVTATTYPEIRYTAISRKVVRKKKKHVHVEIPKDIMGCDQYTFPGTVDVDPTFLAFL